jgi:hypothetical protein
LINQSLARVVHRCHRIWTASSGTIASSLCGMSLGV